MNRMDSIQPVTIEFVIGRPATLKSSVAFGLNAIAGVGRAINPTTAGLIFMSRLTVLCWR